MKQEVITKTLELTRHPLYQNLNDLKSLAVFSEVHCFCVFDFMILAKALQDCVAPSGGFWRPNLVSSAATRAVNEIILEEESDVNPEGGYTSHCDLYLTAMKELGADTSKIVQFMNTGNFEELPKPVKEFVSYHIKLSESKDPLRIAGAFFLGREALLPDVYTALLSFIPQVDCPTLTYYLNRHVELDGRNHAELGNLLISEISSKIGRPVEEAYEAGFETLSLRKNLWDYINMLVKEEKQNLNKHTENQSFIEVAAV